MIFADI